MYFNSDFYILNWHQTVWYPNTHVYVPFMNRVRFIFWRYYKYDNVTIFIIDDNNNKIVVVVIIINIMKLGSLDHLNFGGVNR